MKIIIVCDGGLIQDIVTSEPAEVYTIDYDVEGYDGTLCKIPQRDGELEEAHAIRRVGEVNPKRVNELAEVIEWHEKRIRTRAGRKQSGG